MEASGNPLQYHFRFDGHWNAAGHRLAGAALTGGSLIGAALPDALAR